MRGSGLGIPFHMQTQGCAGPKEAGGGMHGYNVG